MLGSEGEGVFAGGGLDNAVALTGEVLADDGANAGVVVADQDGTFALGGDERGDDDVGHAGGARKHDVEGDTDTEVALGPDGAAVLLDDAAADGEAEAGAALLAGIGGLNLLESVEDGVELIGGDAAALVGDFEQDGVCGGFGMDADGGVGRRKLDRVREQVSEDLEDAVGVAIEEEGFWGGGVGGGGGGELEMDAGGVGHAGHGVEGLLGEVTEGAAADLEGSAAGFHALEVEDVVDQADEAVGVGDGDAEEVLGFGVDVAHDAGREQTEGAADARERGAELVGDGRDELVFDGVEVRPLAEFEAVLILLLVGVRELCGQFPNSSLSSHKGEEESGARGDKREVG